MTATLSPSTRRTVLQTFTKKYSLQLHASSLTFIAGILEQHDLLHTEPGSSDEESQKDAVEMLAKGCLDLGVLEEASGAGSSMITAQQLQHVYSQLIADGDNAAAGPSRNGLSTDASDTMNGSHHGHKDDILAEDSAAPPQRFFDVIDAFEMPKVEWDPVSKAFVKQSGKPSALPPPLSKPLALRQRLQSLRALVLRNENFCPPLPGINRSRGGAQNTWMKLTSTSNLLGRPNGRFLLFGLLTTTSDGRLCLEDEDGRVLLDVENAVPGEGIFTLGSLVLVEGRYADEGKGEMLYVHAIGHPPSETRTRAKEMYGHVDFTGKGAVSAKEERSLSISLQTHHPDLSFVVLSDLHLDVPSTMHSLRAVLKGYIDADFVPFLFIFCGNFLSEEGRRQADGGLGKYQDGFQTLANLLCTFPTLFASSYLLFIPGPSDPYSTTILPRPRLPSLLIDTFHQRISGKLNIALEHVSSRLLFKSNPCRIRFWGKEIVVFRDEIAERLKRNSIPFGSSQSSTVNIGHQGSGEEGAANTFKEGTLRKFLVSTLLDQSHLCPLSQQARPIFWELDHTLRLYPMPNALIIPSSTSPNFGMTYEGCHVINPGSFLSASTSNGAAIAGWTTYYPTSGKGERSELPRS
ncbi:unnamed protein product [Sympodiomycopsis kandeliae]